MVVVGQMKIHGINVDELIKWYIFVGQMELQRRILDGWLHRGSIMQGEWVGGSRSILHQGKGPGAFPWSARSSGVLFS